MNTQTKIILFSSGVLAIVFVVTILFATRVIQSEAEKTREAMSDAAGSIAADSLQQTIDTATNSGQDLADELGTTAKTVFGEIRDILRETPTASERSETTQRPPRKDERTVLRPSEEDHKRVDPASLVGELFKTGQEVTRSIDQALQDVLKLDAGEERVLGRKLNQLILSQHPVIRNKALASKIAALADPFLRQRRRADIEYTFVVLDDPEVNAFAHLGGYVYVNRGLLEFVENEGELRFVLGHEIAHVDLGHCVEQMTYTARASEVVGDIGATLVQAGYQAIALGYSEDKEFEADARSFELLRADQPSVIRFLQRLATIEPEAVTGDSGDAVGVAIQEIEGHFRTHPPTRSRITALGRLD